MAYFGSSMGTTGSYGGPPRPMGGGGGGDRMRNLGADLQQVDWTKINVPPVQWPSTKLASVTLDRSKSEIDEWRKKVGITIMSSDCQNPILSYDECHFLPQYVLDSFKKQGFTAPTPIQSQSWSVALHNRDIVGIAKTGSGKTLSFLVPGMVHILAQPRLERGDGPIMLVLAPTRELAKQIEDECLKVTNNTQIQSVCAYGGTSKTFQKRKFYDGVHIAICCPGRLIDLLSERATNLHRVSYLVMDEADRMLDMGFEPQIRMVCSQVRPDRQTMMFSATWPREVQGLAESFQRNWIRMHVGSLELSANADVRQHVIVIPDFQKVDALMEIVQKKDTFKKILVFVGTKRDADDLCSRLRSQRFFSLAIHGDRNQQQRDSSLEQFRHAKNGILVATDVAQRGLDIRDLDAVVNYDFPMMMEDYVHRIGRTGRAGARGDAFSFINEKHGRLAAELVQMLQRSGAGVSPELMALASRGGGKDFGRRFGAPRGGMMMMAPRSYAPPPAYPPPPTSAYPPRLDDRAPGKRERSPPAARRSPQKERRSPARRRSSTPPRRRRSSTPPARRRRYSPNERSDSDRSRRKDSRSRRRRSTSRRRRSPSSSPSSRSAT